jgi:hypothetical protein
LKNEIIEESLKEPSFKLADMITLEFISNDKSHCFYSLHYPDKKSQKEVRSEEPEQPEVTRIKLHCLKGSLFTFVWNAFARFDDSYQLSIDNTHGKNTGSSVPVTPSNENILWNVSGMDVYNRKISKGFINWNLFKMLYLKSGISSIGLLAFTKVVTRILLLLPLFTLTKKYLVPMPLAFM